ncbi:3-hexulose-6-phosphate synthase [Virgibacillus sp. JSM 102003]|uniref:3-hexulose-6-phosphate synthase n=1 Tax=Virgibacillus sp. JSM 102003 TaxID=1562108 RepID=UPI0035C1FA92
MQLQLALDRLTKEECFHIVKETKEVIDLIEIGTNVIKEYGMSIVYEMKNAYPEKTIVSDMKTCDSGKHEAAQAFDAGADITTVMAFSADKTILDTLEVASQYNKGIMVDLLGISDPVRINRLNKMGVNLLSIHYGKDIQKEDTFNKNSLNSIKGFNNIEVAVAGGINEKVLPSILRMNPSIIIVGSRITESNRSYEVASKIKEMLVSYEKYYS